MCVLSLSVIIVCTQYGKTPLLGAALNGCTEVAMELIKAGADINHKDDVSVHLAHWIVVSEQRLSSMRVLTAVEPGFRCLGRIVAAPVIPVPSNRQHSVGIQRSITPNKKDSWTWFCCSIR